MSKTLRQLKNEISIMEKEDDSSAILNLCNEVISAYPNESYGYLKKINTITDNYNKYLSNDDLNELKDLYEKLYKCSKKDEKAKIKEDYINYLEDCKEVESLIKIKKDITSAYLLKKIYADIILNINNEVDLSKKYSISGKKITNGYDLIKGIFYVICFIYNILNINYLLFITAPFGLFGIILIYSFINMNFIKKESIFNTKISFKKKVSIIDDKIKELKSEINKKDALIKSLMVSKHNNILKIPKGFTNNIKDIIEDNEDDIAVKIKDSLSSNNIAGFTYLIDSETNLKVDDVLDIINKEKIDSEKNKIGNKSELLLIKELKKYNYIVSIVLIVIGILSFTVVIKNSSELYMTGFIVSLIMGVLSASIYNINTGKHKTLTDTFSDNLLATIFNTTLVYDLIYLNNMGNLKISYGFIQMPIIFTIILMGYVSLVSILKYRNLINKLRK